MNSTDPTEQATLVFFGDHYASYEDLKKLDFQVFIRANLCIRRAGTMVEKQIFYDKDAD